MGTYVYCVIAAPRRPAIRRARAGLPGTGRVRVLDVDAGLFLAVADAPLDQYSEAAIARGLQDIDWVSRAAVAHEAVVESFAGATAVLPMKLFTIFAGDERALAHVRGERQRIAGVVKRVAKQQEWGVRVVLDRSRASGGAKRPAARDASGVAYLTMKKAQRDAVVEMVERARNTVNVLYDRLAARARDATRRSTSELPVQSGPLLLDAAFLVPRSRAKSFQALVAREAKSLGKHGYGLTLTGPWPPYSFVQD
jgi:Gas vesicle synthesis protein GvpL/GvpF